MTARNDRSGSTHGVFEVLEFAGTKNNGTLWRCRCRNCGTISIRENRYFRKDRGIPVQCVGCNGVNHALFQGVGEIPLTHLARIKKQALDRGILYDVDDEYLWELFLSQHRECYYTGLPLIFGHHRKETTASLDRLKSSDGYVAGNLVWCHKDINIMKQDYSDDYFITMCSLVSKKVPNVPEA